MAATKLQRRRDSPGPGHDSPDCYAPFPIVHENSGSSNVGVLTSTTSNQLSKREVIQMTYDNNSRALGSPVSHFPLGHDICGTVLHPARHENRLPQPDVSATFVSSGNSRLVVDRPYVPQEHILAQCSRAENCPAYTELDLADPTITIQRPIQNLSNQLAPGLTSQGNMRGSLATMTPVSAPGLA